MLWPSRFTLRSTSLWQRAAVPGFKPLGKCLQTERYLSFLPGPNDITSRQHQSLLYYTTPTVYIVGFYRNLVGFILLYENKAGTAETILECAVAR